MTKILNSIRSLFTNVFCESILIFLGKVYGFQWVYKLYPSHLLYKEETKRSCVRNGIKYILDISDYMEWVIYFNPPVESKNDFYNLLKPNFVVLDIGTNVGEVLLNSAKYVGKNGKVFGFEPSKRIFNFANVNVSLNLFSNIVLHNFGFGDKNETAYLKAEVATNRGGSRINAVDKEGDKIVLKRLDDWITENDIKKIDAIKIDVEGYEYKVISGGVDTLKKFKPILFLEMNDNNLRQQGDDAEIVFFLLKSIYSYVYLAGSTREISNLKEVDAVHYDIICCNEKRDFR